MPIILTPTPGVSSIFHDISAALDNHLSIMADLPSVAWEGQPFEPLHDVLYLRPTNIQGDTVAVTGQDETIGIYQVDIFSPAGEGKNAAVVMADKIANHFAQDTSTLYLTQKVRVRKVSRGSPRTEDGRLVITMDIAYYSFSDRR